VTALLRRYRLGSAHAGSRGTTIAIAREPGGQATGGVAIMIGAGAATMTGEGMAIAVMTVGVPIAPPSRGLVDGSGAA
jgi:hypothetical protein